ncbi:Putative Cellulose-binding domain, fungal, auxiliary Activity family 9 [Colletotrichum destructivum]|uniref:lytic cellulose monooxygenase (C4-dehydrogenating) n=1 Tax=Colletotrichum destructivum TaxID=34406 RepID=A0AAX4I7R8_9PEZI|nr:Putative Cellulose-binding domain, fungal, auxiliary Activity family 9 [Colletotrichum destructivum]
MVNRKTSGLMAVLTTAATVAAHGHVTNVVVNGVSYRNYIPVQDPYTNNPPLVAGWTIEQRDNGFVAPNAYNAPDIICHRQAVSARARITVAAGDTIQLQWTEWPDSHKGPVIDWLANCNGPCNLVEKTDLRFFKIDGAGLINPPQRENRWAASALINNGNAWLVRIPPNVAPGHYVLRHDIIALHSAGQQNGAQSYPQCINLEITGDGTYNPPGTPGTALYKADDAGILYNIYRDNLNDYVVPGDAIISGGVSMLPQSRIQITASGTATPYGTTRVVPSSSTTQIVSSSSTTRVVPSSNSETTAISSSVATSPSSIEVETSITISLTNTVTATLTTRTSSNSPPSSTPAPSQTPIPTTLQTQTTTAPPSGEPVQGLYGQCGGVNYAGPTKCVDYATCSTVNLYYAQCTPAPVPAGSQSLYGQCGGMNWPAASPTACVQGARCSTVNPYYAQCTPA